MDEIEELEKQRDAVLAALNGLRNAPQTKRSLKKHLGVIETLISNLKDSVENNCGPVISTAQKQTRAMRKAKQVGTNRTTQKP